LRSEAATLLCDLSRSMEGAPFTRLRLELRAVVEALPARARFNVIFFNDDVYPFADTLQRATEAARSRAVDFIEHQRTHGDTDLGAALDLALADEGVDTIVLLTDGAPSVGRKKTLEALRAEFQRENRRRWIVLHVVCLGPAPADLEDAARATGGTFKCTAPK
jgi:uncharacterized protein with von Willebrand factor type A (vWA) domain